MKNLGVWDKIEARQGYSQQFVGQIQKIDFLFIDGDHSKEGVSLTLQTMHPIYQKMALGLFMILIQFVTNLGQLGS